MFDLSSIIIKITFEQALIIAFQTTPHTASNHSANNQDLGKIQHFLISLETSSSSNSIQPGKWLLRLLKLAFVWCTHFFREPNQNWVGI
jgi:hypothetical protein